MAIPGLKNKLGMQSLRLAPRSMATSMAASLNRPSEPALPAAPVP
jgi:hypothetical protein